MGPEALRVAGIARDAASATGSRCVDRGNLVGPANPWQPPVDGYRHLRRGRRLEPRWCTTRCYAELQRRPPADPARRRPLPGHRLASARWRAIAARRGKKLRVLWLDAHADFNTSELTPSGNIHGMPVACLCGHGPQELIEIGGTVPAHQPEVDPPDRHPQRRRRREAPRARGRPGGVRHALHRRDGHAPHDGAGAGDAGRQHPPARQLRRRLPRPDDRARRGHHGAGRADLPRGAAVHGDDRRHRPPGHRWT